jgi:hypothetical protein
MPAADTGLAKAPRHIFTKHGGMLAHGQRDPAWHSPLTHALVSVGAPHFRLRLPGLIIDSSF